MDAQLLEVARHLALHVGQFVLQPIDLLLQRSHVDLLFRLGGVHVARNVEVVLVILDLRVRGEVRVLVDFSARAVRVDHLLNVLIGHEVLRFAGRELLAGVNEEDVSADLVRTALLARPVEDQDGDGYTRGREQIGGQTDHSVEQVLFDEGLTDFTFAAAAEENPMRDDHGHTATARPRNLDHVGDESVVTLGLGRNAAPEALVLVLFRVFGAPLIERKGRIGYDDIELHQAVAFDQRRAVERVAPLDTGSILRVEEHIHAGQRPRCAIDLLTVERVVVRTDLFGGADQQRTGTTGWIADSVAGCRARQPGQQARDGGRRVEFTSLLARIGGEARDQIDVALADDVLADARGTKIERGLGEVLKDVLEAAVAVFHAAEIRLGVEIDVAKNAFELCAVLIFDLFERDIDELANVRLIPLRVEIVEATSLGKDEALTLKPAAHPYIVVSILTAIVCDVVVPEVGDVLEE